MIGLYGGSFDPVHQGHVATAAELRERFGFREIRFLPAARSPLKGTATADRHRLAMLERALEGLPGLVIDARELDRPAPSYTIDTLRQVRAELGPDEALVFILGLDSFLELPRWKDWQSLADFAHLLVVGRPGSAWPAGLAPAGERPPGAGSAADPALLAWLAPRLARDPARLAATPAGIVFLAATAAHDIASRHVRAAVRAGQPTSGWLAPAVRDYIDHHHVYCGEADPQ